MKVLSTYELRDRCAAIAENPKYTHATRAEATDYWDWFEAAFNGNISLDIVAKQERKASAFLKGLVKK